jgi:hypothetical protein
MRIDPKEQWSINLVLLAIEADRLSNREDMPFIKCAFERGTAMSRRAKDDTLFGDLRMRSLLVVRGDQP